MLNPNAFKNPCGNYRFAPINGVLDTTLLDVAAQAEKKLKKSVPFCSEEALTSKFSNEENVLVTTKYDGEGTFLYYEENESPTEEKPEIFLFNPSSGRSRTGLPCLEQAAFKLKNAGVKKLLARTEIYLPALESRRRTIFDVMSATASTDENIIAEFKIAVISLTMLNGENWMEKPILENWEKIEELFGNNTENSIHRTHGVICQGSEMTGEYKKIVESEEGTVIHSLSRNESYKTKPQKTIDAAVIGYVEGEFEGKYGVRSILTALTYEAGGHQENFLTFCRIYSGMTDEEAVELLPKLQERKTNNPIQMTDHDGRVIQMVKPGLIVEAKGEDIVTVKRDTPHKAQLFRWDRDKWEFCGVTNAPRLTFATYKGIREDKTLESGGARIEQAVENPVLPQFKAPTGEEAKITERKVWIKTLKSGEVNGLRKFVHIQNDREGFIPHVLVFSDFSPKRKDPLKTTCLYAFEEKRASQLLENWTEENIKRGWEEQQLQTS